MSCYLGIRLYKKVKCALKKKKRKKENSCGIIVLSCLVITQSFQSKFESMLILKLFAIF